MMARQKKTVIVVVITQEDTHFSRDKIINVSAIQEKQTVHAILPTALLLVIFQLVIYNVLRSYLINSSIFLWTFIFFYFVFIFQYTSMSIDTMTKPHIVFGNLIRSCFVLLFFNICTYGLSNVWSQIYLMNLFQ